MQIIYKWFLFFLVLSLSGCGSESGSSTSLPDSGPVNPDVVVPGEPYIVLIGDSISEGHPALHGRLHPAGSSGFDPDYKSQPGQLSYEFAQHFRVPVINHGIGGQTSTQVRSRWNRDVLHQISDPGDGLGDSTMTFGGQLPYAVYLHVGVNDVFTGLPVETVKDNMRFFAESAKDNGIKLIVDNIGADSVYDLTKEAAAREINNWLSGEFTSLYPEVEIMDYLHWSTDGTFDYKHLKPGMFVDTVHPSKAGYADFAVYVSDNINTQFK
ncbi:GDSL-type esterase/lipase family protein [Vibrio parahaemolyticus]|uniref:GDSL-type esterase/lipase family protein n=1 Tax=Vibrio parahaemolyticus TaxID=670 RepID=UPI00235FD546|nr:GDSL-type esterase/lipase family protein [Vibrio parahaemolyticus]